eukprot:5609810-Amphidinium_carterae.1
MACLSCLLRNSIPKPLGYCCPHQRNEEQSIAGNIPPHVDRRYIPPPRRDVRSSHVPNFSIGMDVTVSPLDRGLPQSAHSSSSRKASSRPDNPTLT